MPSLDELLGSGEPDPSRLSNKEQKIKSGVNEARKAIALIDRKIAAAKRRKTSLEVTIRRLQAKCPHAYVKNVGGAYGAQGRECLICELYSL